MRPLNVPIGNLNKSNVVLIDDMPTYIWHRGCGPTALGMIVGFYDLHGFYDLYDDSTLLQTNNINMLIASMNIMMIIHYHRIITQIYYKTYLKQVFLIRIIQLQIL